MVSMGNDLNNPTITKLRGIDDDIEVQTNLIYKTIDTSVGKKFF
jgi:hypothetical protein